MHYSWLQQRSKMCSVNLNWCCWRKTRIQRQICCPSYARSTTISRRNSRAFSPVKQCAALIVSSCPSCSTSESQGNSSQTFTFLVWYKQIKDMECGVQHPSCTDLIMYFIFRWPSRSLAVLQRDVPIGRLHTELPCRPGHHQPLQTAARHKDDKEGRARTANFLQHCSDSCISKMNWGHPWGCPVLTEGVVPNGDLVRRLHEFFNIDQSHMWRGWGSKILNFLWTSSRMVPFPIERLNFFQRHDDNGYVLACVISYLISKFLVENLRVLNQKQSIRKSRPTNQVFCNFCI